MRKPALTNSRFSVILSVFILFSAPLYAAGIDVSDPELFRWYSLVDADFPAVEQVLGSSFIDINPSNAESRAERIIWYKNGITLWFEDGRVSQLRIDSAAGGTAAGIGIGSMKPEVISRFGRPWIEDDENLYYNLPWRSGPVRLRLIFSGSGLSEIYLYIVR